MDASTTNFQPIFEGVKQYVVPLFQRSYSWTKKNWEVLWNDLQELYETENPRNHFMGSIVTIPTKSVPEGVTKYLLIDGQQRITTIYLILMALGDIYRDRGETESYEEIKNVYLVNTYKKGKDFYKVLPTQVDRYVFETLSKTPEIKAQHGMWEAYHYFKRKLSLNIDLDKIKTILTTKLSVVSIVLDEVDNPYLVFESLNHKGKPLSVSDLIRNYVFMKIHIEKQDMVYNEVWKPMQDRLGDSMPEFVRHFLTMNGDYINTGDVYGVLKDKIDKLGIDECLQQLEKYSEYYGFLLKPETVEDEEIRKSLQMIKRLDISTSYPLLLNFFALYDEKAISKKEFISMLEVIENYIIRRFVCGVPTNQLNKTFPQVFNWMQKIPNGTYIEKLKHVLQSKNYPKDYDFRSSLQTARLYGNGDRRVKTKIILDRLEQSFKHKEMCVLEDMTIEHVMPQTLTGEWELHLGEDYEQTHDLYLDTLGNLTLTAYNPELSNGSFLKKQKIYAESHMEINGYFSNVKKWTDEEIKKRACVLAEQVIGIYPYFGEIVNGSELDNVTGTKPVSLFVLGQEFNVDTWVEVLENTLQVVADLDPDKLELIENDYPSLLGKENRFSRGKKLSNGYFYETKLGSKHVYNFCKQLVNIMELSEDEWTVQCKKNYEL